MILGGIVVIAANAGGAWSPIGDVTTTMLWMGGQVTVLPLVSNVFLPSVVCTAVAGILPLDSSSRCHFDMPHSPMLDTKRLSRNCAYRNDGSLSSHTRTPCSVGVEWLKLGGAGPLSIPEPKAKTSPRGQKLIFGAGVGAAIHQHCQQDAPLPRTRPLRPQDESRGVTHPKRWHALSLLRLQGSCLFLFSSRSRSFLLSGECSSPWEHCGA